MLEALETKLHTEIPMTKLMQLHVKSMDEKELITTAPLEPNINDKGTAFGGSSNSMTIISGWSACLLIAESLGFDKTMIAIIKNQSSFRAPITKDLICHTYLPTKEQIEKIKEKLLSKGSTSIKIKAEIIENERVCLDFEGVYVIKLK